MQLEAQSQDCVAPSPFSCTFHANLKPQVVSVVLVTNQLQIGVPLPHPWAQLKSHLQGGCETKVPPFKKMRPKCSLF